MIIFESDAEDSIPFSQSLLAFCIY